MKRSTVPTDVVTGGDRRRRRPAHVVRRGPFRVLGLLAVAVVLGASSGSAGGDAPQSYQRATDTALDAGPGGASTASSGRGQEIGADGDTAPRAEPPPAEHDVVAPVAPAGEDRTVVLPRLTSTNGVPTSVLAAYRHATAILSRSQPACHLEMPLLAAIGKVESAHARGGRVDAAGTTLSAILGPVLNGTGGTAAIRDTDGGRHDGNTVWDRAVGPMQFIPGTWARWGSDGNADGFASPHNVYDAALSSGRYLCANGRDLSTAHGLRAAIFSYNHSDSYVRLVIAWMNAYAGGTAAVPDGTGPAGGNDDRNAQAAPAPNGPGSSGPDQPRPGQPGAGGPSTPGQPGPGQPGPGQPGPGQPGPGDPSDPGQPNPGDPTDPGDDPGTTPPGTTPPGTTPPGEPDPTEPPPAEPGPVTAVVCTVQGVVSTGTGLIGGLIGLQPPPPPPDCAAPATP